MKKLILLICLLICSNCFAAEVKILHTSDVHGRISPVTYKDVENQGGFARRVEFINDFRQKNKNVLVLDSGDCFQGSLYYRLDYGKAEAKLMPLIKYDAITFGNHEFDNGEKVLKTLVKKSKTQFISANVHFYDKYMQKVVKPYIIKDFDGEKFLIIGVTTSKLPTLSDTSYASVTDATEEIKKIISTVPHDKVIVLSHCGIYEDEKIAKSIPEIDLILGGHNHYYFEKPEYVNNVPIIHDGEFGMRIGIIDFDEKIKNYSYVYIDSKIKSDDKALKKVNKIEKTSEKITHQVVAKTQDTLIGDQTIIEQSQTNLGRLVLISMAKDFNNIDGVITNSGSIRINKNLKGNISYADLLEIIPFDNTVVLVEVTGKDLKTIFKHGKQTNRRYLQYYLKNTNIQDNKTYRIVTNSYIASGKDGYSGFANCKVIQKATKTPTALLKETLQDLNTITNQKIYAYKL